MPDRASTANRGPRIFASAIFAGIAIVLVIQTRVPPRGGLRAAEGAVTSIRAARNTWYEVEISTADGARLTCRGRRGGPAIGPSRCPIEAFEQVLGARVSVLHDGQRPFEVKRGGEVILGYSAHRRGQTMGIALAGLMFAGAVGVWVRR